jgi:hypothetical protein
MHTGSIVDFYDDPQGLVLRERLPQEQVPEFIKQAEFLDEAARDSLPDDVFALVMVDQGEKLRKFACTDKGNTALNVIYFMENRDRLPEEAQKVAAANLAQACAWYDLDIPIGLHKEAGLGSLLKAPGKVLSGGLMASDMAGRASTGMAAHRQMMSKTQELVGSNIMPTSSDTEKTASDAATQTHYSKLVEKKYGMPEGQVYNKINPPDAELDALWQQAVAKTKKASLQPYVDVTGQQPPAKIKQASAQRFCLVKTGQARFPIDSYGQIKQAAAWFDEYGHTLHPAERREYCVKLAARADEVGIEVSDLIKKYGSPSYATDGEVNVAVCTRMQHWAEDSPERDMLQGLMEKAASVPPDVFCEALRQFDEATGMNHLWDDEIYDPYFSTYGFMKKASWKWEEGNDRITDEDLHQGLHESKRAIKESFGEDFLDEFLKEQDPTVFFDSLPRDHKRILARIITDH